MIAFRLYLDLERGWRVTMPNLEQTGLLEIDYADLQWVAERQDRWEQVHPSLREADASLRAEIMKALLDEMRRSLAIDVQYFRDDFDSLQSASEERLVDPWRLSKSDSPKVATAYPSRPGPGWTARDCSCPRVANTGNICVARTVGSTRRWTPPISRRSSRIC
ncbi:hypothetical protein NKH18_23870 [Streptomyces sp. M10(2022)]